MAATYDTTTDRGKVRLLISDTDTTDAIFDDAEIDVFLDLRGDDVHLAAATALRAIAGNEAQVLKRIRLLDLDLNGPAVAQSLRELADTYEREADDADGAGDLDWAPVATGAFGWRERVWNERLRD